MNFKEARRFLYDEYPPASEFSKLDLAITEALGMLDIIKRQWYDYNCEVNGIEREIREVISKYADKVTDTYG